MILKMKYIDEYRSKPIIKGLTEKINQHLSRTEQEIVLMEVCGTHTMAISRSGLRKVLSSKLRLVSGPGCPVCVTPNYYLDKAIAYARKQGIIIVTFGDMLKVPGSSSSLEKEKASGRDIRVVYSSLDGLKIAEDNPEKKIVFLGVGFETTAPTLGATIKIAKEQNIKNFFVFSGHKTMPLAMRALVSGNGININGFICPGHVSTIIGAIPYAFIPEEYNISCVITGFEPVDIAQGIYMLIENIIGPLKPRVQIQYKRTVKKEGNPKAIQLMQDVFEETDSQWRGLGDIPGSGLKIRDAYRDFDAEKNIEVKVEKTKETIEWICGEVLKGLKTPLDCRLFKKKCTPTNPVGACMVSSEGTCSAYYKYE